MAEALFNARAPAGWRATSAGTRPAARANPRTARFLEELGVRPPPHPPQLLTPTMMESSELQITMGCLDDASCPARLREGPRRDWALPDPARLDDAGFRRVRDQVERRVRELLAELAAEPATDSAGSGAFPDGAPG